MKLLTSDDALLTDSLPTTIGNYKAYPFLQRTHRLCYSYSLALLAEKQQQQIQISKRVQGATAVAAQSHQAHSSRGGNHPFTKSTDNLVKSRRQLAH